MAVKEDIPLLVAHFIKENNANLCKNILGVSEYVEHALRDYPWPGNVRELKNTIRSAMLLTDRVIGMEHLPETVRTFLQG